MEIENPRPHQPRAAQCDGKQRYDSASDASKALRRSGHKLRPYRCPHCGGWHMAGGHNLGTVRKRNRK